MDWHSGTRRDRKSIVQRNVFLVNRVGEGGLRIIRLKHLAGKREPAAQPTSIYLNRTAGGSCPHTCKVNCSGQECPLCMTLLISGTPALRTWLPAYRCWSGCGYSRRGAT